MKDIINFLLGVIIASDLVNRVQSYNSSQMFQMKKGKMLSTFEYIQKYYIEDNEWYPTILFFFLLSLLFIANNINKPIFRLLGILLPILGLFFITKYSYEGIWSGASKWNIAVPVYSLFAKTGFISNWFGLITYIVYVLLFISSIKQLFFQSKNLKH